MPHLQPEGYQCIHSSAAQSHTVQLWKSFNLTAWAPSALCYGMFASRFSTLEFRSCVVCAQAGRCGCGQRKGGKAHYLLHWVLALTWAEGGFLWSAASFPLLFHFRECRLEQVFIALRYNKESIMSITLPLPAVRVNVLKRLKLKLVDSPECWTQASRSNRWSEKREECWVARIYRTRSNTDRLVSPYIFHCRTFCKKFTFYFFLCSFRNIW